MAINHLKEFYISYPETHEKQREIATSSCETSGVGFDNCAGAIDGIIIWTHMPSEKDVGDDIGRKSFLCACKGKFGINMQAVSNRRGRILDMSIKCGGLSSDCLALESGRLYKRLTRGLLAPGLVYLVTMPTIFCYSWQHLFLMFLLGVRMTTISITLSFASVLNVHLACWSIAGVYFILPSLKA
jgi:hypothetical protein